MRSLAAIVSALLFWGVAAAQDRPPDPDVGVSEVSLSVVDDASGVDLGPYTLGVAEAVRQNWIAKWPDQAGQGLVVAQFRIARSGGVPKIVIESASGIQGLVRTAVAAISGSVPFPSLPQGFSGDTLTLRAKFVYGAGKPHQ
jgi:hypothetical protein